MRSVGEFEAVQELIASGLMTRSTARRGRRASTKFIWAESLTPER
jgi:hypothetical protein